MSPLRKAWIAVMAATSCIFLLAGCGGGGGGGSPDPAPVVVQPPPPPAPGPAVPPAAHTVRGEVFSFETGMIPHADVNLWVQTPGFGYSYWWANGRLGSDALGLFEARVPTSAITVLAFVAGFVQPCGVKSDVSGDVEVRVEMQPVSNFNSINPPLPQLARDPWVTGTVYERTASGLVPIAGAGIWAETGMEIGIATTLTNPDGRFFMCNLAEDTWLGIFKDGFETLWMGPFDAANHPWGFLEIVLERKRP